MSIFPPTFDLRYYCYCWTCTPIIRLTTAEGLNTPLPRGEGFASKPSSMLPRVKAQIDMARELLAAPTKQMLDSYGEDTSFATVATFSFAIFHYHSPSHFR
jgi:hypothetical protein